jgi:hypothetical protein
VTGEAYGVWRVAHESVDVGFQASQVHLGCLHVVERHAQWLVVFEYLIHVFIIG